jgi:hypothetical protein
MFWTRRLGLAAVAAAASVGVLAAAPAAAGVHASGTWGTAITVPGIAKLNNGNSQVISMSCAASGDCAAVGSYQRQGNRVFVADETGGTWGTAAQFPGLATLNKGKTATVNQVSCGAPGNCAAGGTYADASGNRQGWLATETGGVWHAAHGVNGLAALNKGGFATVIGVSCPAGTSGDCTAAGYYTTAGQTDQLAFTISEKGGTWGKAAPIPGQSSLPNEDPNQTALFVTSLSCAPGAAGNCALTGNYFATVPTEQAFVADSAGGVWANAEQIPGSAALNAGGFAEGDAVSCPAAGHCSLGGTYNDGSPATQGFVAQQSGGVWANAEAIPGLAALNKEGFVALSSLSCGAAGDCAAGGSYTASGSPFSQPTFVVTETGGAWGKAEQVPGLAALSDGNFESLNSVSCSAAGQCSAGGFYSTATAAAEAFVANETGGTWQTAQEVPGTAALNTGNNATTFAVSCAPGGSCALGGDYRYSKAGTNGHEQAFVDNQG